MRRLRRTDGRVRLHGERDDYGRNVCRRASFTHSLTQTAGARAVEASNTAMMLHACCVKEYLPDLSRADDDALEMEKTWSAVATSARPR